MKEGKEEDQSNETVNIESTPDVDRSEQGQCDLNGKVAMLTPSAVDKFGRTKASDRSWSMEEKVGLLRCQRKTIGDWPGRVNSRVCCISRPLCGERERFLSLSNAASPAGSVYSFSRSGQLCRTRPKSDRANAHRKIIGDICCRPHLGRVQSGSACSTQPRTEHGPGVWKKQVFGDLFATLELAHRWTFSYR